MTFSDRLLAKIATDIARDSSVELNMDTELLLSGLVDSLGLLTLVDWIQGDQRIGIDPGDMELENFQTAGRIVEFTERQIT